MASGSTTDPLRSGHGLRPCCCHGPGRCLLPRGGGAGGARRAPVERSDRRSAAHLGTHGRESCVRAAAQAGCVGPAGPRGDRRPGPDGHFVGLPASITTFVGRSTDRAAILAALDDSRLVTVVGPGGVGKTRLVAMVADGAQSRFPAGGAFVDLVPVRPGSVLRAVAAALDATEGPARSVEAGVFERLRVGRPLLVLDNCEHAAPWPTPSTDGSGWVPASSGTAPLRSCRDPWAGPRSVWDDRPIGCSRRLGWILSRKFAAG